MPIRLDRPTALGVLVPTTIGVVWMSEILVRQVEPVVASLGVSEFFLGVILVPIIGNIAEHLVAVSVALKNQMSLSVEIAIGSSLQVALFVVPFLVFFSLVMGNPLSLVFNQLRADRPDRRRADHGLRRRRRRVELARRRRARRRCT